MTLFYCAHWQTYVSGTLKFGKIDVTEAQFAIIGIHLVSAIFGSEIWLMTVSNRFCFFFVDHSKILNIEIHCDMFH